MQPRELHDAAAPNLTNSDKIRSFDSATKRVVPPGYIALGVAMGIPDVLRDLGAVPERVLGKAGHNRRLFDHPDNVISVAALGRLILHCIEQTNCPHFGLLMGEKATLKSLRVVGTLMSSSATLGDALHVLEAHLWIQDRGAVVHSEIDEDIIILNYSAYEPSGEGAVQISEGALATTIGAIRELCGPRFAPSEVLIPRREPADLEPYRRIFRAPVRFNQEKAALVFPANWLHYRIRTFDACSRGAIETRVLELEAFCAAGDLVDELRRKLRIELMSSRCSASSMSRRLSMHRRTLNRHLKAEGTNYRTVVDEVRFAIARQLVADTDMPLAEISAALDFSEPAAFTRAFHRWAGRAPRDWRLHANR
jgi:AraC-like DNA-binding protein